MGPIETRCEVCRHGHYVGEKCPVWISAYDDDGNEADLPCDCTVGVPDLIPRGTEVFYMEYNTFEVETGVIGDISEDGRRYRLKNPYAEQRLGTYIPGISLYATFKEAQNKLIEHVEHLLERAQQLKPPTKV